MFQHEMCVKADHVAIESIHTTNTFHVQYKEVSKVSEKDICINFKSILISFRFFEIVLVPCSFVTLDIKSTIIASISWSEFPIEKIRASWECKRKCWLKQKICWKNNKVLSIWSLWHIQTAHLWIRELEYRKWKWMD